VDLARELAPIKGSSRAAYILDIGVQRFRTSDKPFFLKTISLALEEERIAGDTDRLIKRNCIVLRIVTLGELKKGFSDDASGFLEVISPWEPSWVLVENDFVAFVYLIVDLRDRKEFRRAQALIKAFRLAMECGGLPVHQNRFIVSFFDAQLSEQLQEKSAALRTARACLEELTAVTPGEQATVLGAAVTQQIRNSAENIIARSTSNLPFRHQNPKVGRNDPCPCGSGKKFKHCHGK
jgi:hypothetical protein